MLPQINSGAITFRVFYDVISSNPFFELATIYYKNNIALFFINVVLKMEYSSVVLIYYHQVKKPKANNTSSTLHWLAYPTTMLSITFYLVFASSYDKKKRSIHFCS